MDDNENYDPYSDPNYQVAAPQYGFLKTLLGNAGAALTGRVGPTDATALTPALGFNPYGVSQQALQTLLQMPERRAQLLDLQEKIQTGPARRKLLEAQAEKASAEADLSNTLNGIKSGKDVPLEDQIKALNSLSNISKNPMALLDPNMSRQFAQLPDLINSIMKKMKIPQLPQSGKAATLQEAVEQFRARVRNKQTGQEGTVDSQEKLDNALANGWEQIGQE